MEAEREKISFLGRVLNDSLMILPIILISFSFFEPVAKAEEITVRANFANGDHTLETYADEGRRVTFPEPLIQFEGSSRGVYALNGFVPNAGSFPGWRLDHQLTSQIWGFRQGTLTLAGAQAVEDKLKIQPANIYFVDANGTIWAVIFNAIVENGELRFHIRLNQQRKDGQIIDEIFYPVTYLSSGLNSSATVLVVSAGLEGALGAGTGSYHVEAYLRDRATGNLIQTFYDNVLPLVAAERLFLFDQGFHNFGNTSPISLAVRSAAMTYSNRGMEASDNVDANSNGLTGRFESAVGYMNEVGLSVAAQGFVGLFCDLEGPDKSPTCFSNRGFRILAKFPPGTLLTNPFSITEEINGHSLSVEGKNLPAGATATLYLQSAPRGIGIRDSATPGDFSVTFRKFKTDVAQEQFYILNGSGAQSFLMLNGSTRIYQGTPIDGGYATEVTGLLYSSLFFDSDGDGVIKSIEDALGTDDNNPDSDGDGIGDGSDPCPAGVSSTIAIVDARACSEVVKRGDCLENVDYDSDGVVTIADNCPAATNPFQEDTDGDGVGDLCDADPDMDRDGFSVSQGDCNDGDAAVHPGATEVCNGKDDNCNGLVDEGVLKEWSVDGDADGYASGIIVLACERPTPLHKLSSELLSIDRDCSDGNPAVHPDALEICNGFDDDCDGLVDEGVKQEWVVDADADSYPAPFFPSVQACERPDSFSRLSSEMISIDRDCNDLDAAVHPGAPELCNERDDDCDDLVDEGVKKEWSLDGDNDGYASNIIVLACERPLIGYKLSSELISIDRDCDDTDAAVHPGATEVCNGKDDDCDKLVDDADPSVIGRQLWYPDQDRDLYGDKFFEGRLMCQPPAGEEGLWVLNNTDCLDTNAAVHPGAAELCNGFDDNCNGLVDEGDANGDGLPDCLGGLMGIDATKPFTISLTDTSLTTTNTGLTYEITGTTVTITSPLPGTLNPSITFDAAQNVAIDNHSLHISATTLNGGATGNIPLTAVIVDGLNAKPGFFHTVTVTSALSAVGAPAPAVAILDTEVAAIFELEQIARSGDLRNRGATVCHAASGGRCERSTQPDGSRQWEIKLNHSGFVEFPDFDGDNYAPPADCDDSNAAIHPEAAEVCDGIDNNCNGVKDEGFPNFDGDGLADCVDPDDDDDGVNDASDICPLGVCTLAQFEAATLGGEPVTSLIRNAYKIVNGVAKRALIDAAVGYLTRHPEFPNAAEISRELKILKASLPPL